MKILFYKEVPKIYSTLLTFVLAEELELLGHETIFGEVDAKELPPKKFDWVWGHGAKAWDAVNFAKAHGAKVHIHLEGVAYWRIGMGDAKDWGYAKNLTHEEIDWHRKQYKKWMSAAYEADSCSVNGERQIEAIQSLFGGKILPNCHKLSCGVDARYANTLRSYYPKKWQMVTASRLEENKKVFMIAEALSKLDVEKLPIWVVIGYGNKDQLRRFVAFCSTHKIKLRMRSYYGAGKWRIINDSCLMLQGWSGIPPAEGLMVKTPVLSFNHYDIVEMYDDSIHWAKDNDTDDYARKVEELLDNVKKSDCNWLDDVTVNGKDKLLKGQLYACTQEQLAKYYSTRIFI